MVTTRQGANSCLCSCHLNVLFYLFYFSSRPCYFPCFSQAWWYPAPALRRPRPRPQAPQTTIMFAQMWKREGSRPPLGFTCGLHWGRLNWWKSCRSVSETRQNINFIICHLHGLGFCVFNFLQCFHVVVLCGILTRNYNILILVEFQI